MASWVPDAEDAIPWQGSLGSGESQPALSWFCFPFSIYFIRGRVSPTFLTVTASQVFPVIGI